MVIWQSWRLKQSKTIIFGCTILTNLAIDLKLFNKKILVIKRTAFCYNIALLQLLKECYKNWTD